MSNFWFWSCLFNFRYDGMEYLIIYNANLNIFILFMDYLLWLFYFMYTMLGLLNNNDNQR